MEQRIVYDIVRVYFCDGTTTQLHVHEDDDIPATIHELCDREGWHHSVVTNFEITGQLEDR